jgi:DNA-binding NarL/FixJ family response regulator
MVLMARKIKMMNQVKQLLIMHHQGKGKKIIARALDMSKNTVKSYIDKFELLLKAK